MDLDLTKIQGFILLLLLFCLFFFFSFPSSQSKATLPQNRVSSADSLVAEEFLSSTVDHTSLAGGTVLKLCNFREWSGWGHVPTAPHNSSQALAVWMAAADCGWQLRPMKEGGFLVEKPVTHQQPLAVVCSHVCKPLGLMFL